MRSYQIIMLIVSAVLVSSAHAKGPNELAVGDPKYKRQIRQFDDICQAPVSAYVNDEVILGDKATFEEYRHAFPSNYNHFLTMFAFVGEGESECAGRYRGAHSIGFNYWFELFSKKNAFEWYQITLSNLAGRVYMSRTESLFYWLEAAREKESTQFLPALKSLPLGTQKLIVNAFAPTDEDLDGMNFEKPYRRYFQINGIDNDQVCKHEFCQYLTTLVDEDYRTMGVGW